MRTQVLLLPRSLVLAAFVLASMAAIAGGRDTSSSSVDGMRVPAPAASCLGAAAGIVEPGACDRRIVTL